MPGLGLRWGWKSLGNGENTNRSQEWHADGGRAPVRGAAPGTPVGRVWSVTLLARWVMICTGGELGTHFSLCVVCMYRVFLRQSEPAILRSEEEIEGLFKWFGASRHLQVKGGEFTSMEWQTIPPRSPGFDFLEEGPPRSPRYEGVVSR